MKEYRVTYFDDKQLGERQSNVGEESLIRRIASTARKLRYDNVIVESREVSEWEEV